MYSRIKLNEKITTLGFSLAKRTKQYDRFTSLHKKGSLYIKENYISATGDYKELENNIHRTSSDSKGCPEWKGDKINNLLRIMGTG
ncbi:hypothetical protein SPONN_1825 [uncultured Candidatus Thioglobus sp.]|nr:hypothetical protein SPONN_1825 [uncultured Candidatus Thioglobus sp.]